MARQLRGRHASLIACSLLLLVAPSIPGCEEDIGDGLLCCETSAFRGCCWDEPLAAGGSDSPDSNLCGGPTRLPIPACGEFPVSSGIDTRGCEILFEDTSAEPCECTPPEDGCEPICAVPEPPSLPDACAGVTSVSENPSSCPATGNVVTYAVTEIAAVPDSASGFDLDGTAESSCVEGALTVPDAPNGVDNSLAAVDLSLLNRELFNRACKGAVTTSFQVDANVEEACATVTVLDSGDVVTSAAPLNLTGACLHGTLDQFLLPLLEPAPLENVRLTATLDDTGFSNMTLGATAGAFSAALIFDVLKDAPDYWKYLEIRTDLDVTGALQCDSISLTVELGGVTE